MLSEIKGRQRVLLFSFVRTQYAIAKDRTLCVREFHNVDIPLSNKSILLKLAISSSDHWLHEEVLCHSFTCPMLADAIVLSC